MEDLPLGEHEVGPWIHSSRRKRIMDSTLRWVHLSEDGISCLYALVTPEAAGPSLASRSTSDLIEQAMAVVVRVEVDSDADDFDDDDFDDDFDNDDDDE